MNMRLAVCIKTVGCRTNQADSLQIMRKLEPLDVRLVKNFEDADIIIINTCAVTSRAERDVRLYLGQARRRSPRALIAVAGCMTGITPPSAWAKFGHVEIFSNAGKNDIPGWVEKIARRDPPPGREKSETSGPRRVLRPPVKVQEGCAMSCSYCIVPRTRGPERSTSVEVIVEKIRWFVERGAKEIVLTGTQLGSWGKDLDPPLAVADLLDTLLEKDAGARIRLSSIEPWGVDEKLVKVFSGRPGRLCPHLHIPLQSGCDAVLRNMNRPYTAPQYAEIIEALLKADPDISLGTDLIVGFPGEGEAQLEETLGFVRGLPLAYLHVFSYSRREGTPAAGMKGGAAQREIRERVAAFKKLDDAKRKAYMEKYIGRKVQAVIEKLSADDELSGTAAQFFKVVIPDAGDSAGLVGEIVDVRPLRVESNKAVSKIV
ncbi:MAG: MiaB/RimO family radical SAM methylthiotransferase [Pseudomonadota bacterium]